MKRRCKSPAPNIKAIRADTARRMIVTWQGGVENVIDLSPLLAKYGTLAPLRAGDDLFRRVRVGEWGWCARWTDEIEISSDTLWRLALRAR